MLQNLLNLTDNTLAYMAGVVDADGSISIISVGNTRQHVVRLTVTNTNQEMLNLFESIFGGKKRLRVWKGEAKANWKPCYEWCLTADQGAKAIRLLYPFLIVKKRQAQLALRLDRLKKSVCSGRCRWDSIYNNRRLVIYERLKRQCVFLNQRGLHQPDRSSIERVEAHSTRI